MKYEQRDCVRLSSSAVGVEPKCSHQTSIEDICFTKEEAENAQHDGHFQEALAKLASTLVLRSISRGSYDVSVQIKVF